jgi:hypothetical protein
VKTVAIAVGLVVTIHAAHGLAQAPRTALQFQVPVVPDVVRHVDMLTVPAYLALALENNGFQPSMSSRLVVKDRQTFQIKDGFVRYKGKKGAIYSYDAGVFVSLGITDKEITVPVEVDTSTIRTGKLLVSAYPPLADILPNELIDKIEMKVASLASLPVQRKILTYLDDLTEREDAKVRGFDGVLEAIAFEAYNKSDKRTLGRSNSGEAEPLSDQVLLLLTVAIWLIGFPVFLLVVRRQRKSAAATRPH